MARLRIAFLGDVVGEPGRRAFAHAVPILRRDRAANIVIVNGENARHGRGLHPDGYDELIRAAQTRSRSVTMPSTTNASPPTSTASMLRSPAR
ncbi:YmdB family metallophosphoesterase [Phycisphaerales bacterium ac7]